MENIAVTKMGLALYGGFSYVGRPGGGFMSLYVER